MSERFEQSDLSGRLIARAGAWLAGALLLIGLTTYGMLHLAGSSASAPHVSGPEAPTPQWGEPVPEDYRWADRERKIISIPIERAIDLTAERGLPARSKP